MVIDASAQLAVHVHPVAGGWIPADELLPDSADGRLVLLHHRDVPVEVGTGGLRGLAERQELVPRPGLPLDPVVDDAEVRTVDLFANTFECTVDLLGAPFPFPIGTPTTGLQRVAASARVATSTFSVATHSSSAATSPPPVALSLITSPTEAFPNFSNLRNSAGPAGCGSGAGSRPAGCDVQAGCCVSAPAAVHEATLRAARKVQ